MNYWLMKTEPSCYSLDDLKNRPDGTDCWDGVRNYQARNMMRDDFQVGDGVLIYHSSCAEPAIVGLAQVVRAGYPDHTARDPRERHFDPRATDDEPIWYMVDVRYVRHLPQPLNRDFLRSHPVLSTMGVLRRGDRLSVQPVTAEQWEAVVVLSAER